MFPSLRSSMRLAFVASVALAYVAAPLDSVGAQTGSTNVAVSQQANTCAPLIAQGVTEARSGDPAAAERSLNAAMAKCPGDAAGYREMAGLRLVQKRWNESIEFAGKAIRLSPSDTNAWEILATARFASSNTVRALDAWNRNSPVTIRTIHVDGLRTTPASVVRNAIGLKEGDTLTSGAFLRAARRLDDLPTSTESVLEYTPLDDGSVNLSALLNERRRAPSGWLAWGMAGVVTGLTREIRADLAGLASQGDLWQPSFRWPHRRRRGALDVAFPAPVSHRGIIDISAYWERQTYRDPIADDTFAELRERIEVMWSDWITSAVRVEAGAAFDRLAGTRYTAVRGGLTTRLAGDHLAAHVRGEHWFPSQGAERATQADIIVDWRSHTNQRGPHWLARAGMSGVTEGAPLALWPGAGSILNRTALLRGRELIYGHVISGDAFGRLLAFGTIERRHPIVEIPFARVAVAGFADTARAWKRLTPDSDSRFHVDAGAGLRIIRPGDRTELRLDFGVGLRDGSVRVSAGYVAAWGRR